MSITMAEQTFATDLSHQSDSSEQPNFHRGAEIASCASSSIHDNISQSPVSSVHTLSHVASDAVDERIGCTPISSIQRLEDSSESHPMAQENTSGVHAPLPVAQSIDISNRTNDSTTQHGSDATFSNTALAEHNLENIAQALVSANEPRWSPFYLSRPFLLGNASVYILLIVGLEVLQYFSKEYQGLGTVSQDLQYVWTYGPVFVLTLLASLWGQIEYRARQLMPWYLMNKDSISAEQILLLNYITSTTPGSLFRSVKRGHFLVSLGISGSLLLRLLVIFSTGLLSLEYTPMAHDKEFLTRDMLDLAEDMEYSRNVPRVSNGANFWASLRYNLSGPDGTTSRFAVQSFGPSEDGFYESTTADVQVFEAKLDNCQTFQFTYPAAQTLSELFDGLFLELPEQYTKLWEPWCYATTLRGGPTALAEEVIGDIMNLTEVVQKCPNSTSTENGHRIFITLDSPSGGLENELSGALCEPTYSLTRRAVTNTTDTSGKGYTIHVSPEVKENLELGIEPINITLNLISSLGRRDTADSTEIPTRDVTGNIWYTLLDALDAHQDFSDLRNASLAAELSSQMWPAFSALATKTGHKSTPNDRQTLPGTVLAVEGRLFIRELSLRLMEALLAILALSSIALTLSFSPVVFDRDPGSVGAHALIMARSTRLMHLLAGYGTASKQALKDRLVGYKASLPRQKLGGDQVIALTPVEAPNDITSRPVSESQTENCKATYWHPFTAAWWLRLAIIFAALAVIVTLEVLLQTSVRNNGLADVNTDRYQKYAWTYIPTLVMSSIGFTFTLVDSTARVLHPFQLLRNRKHCTRFEEILFDPAAHLSLVALFYAASGKYPALFAIMFVGLLAPTLSIAASGLYVPLPDPWSHTDGLQMQDWFNIDVRYPGDANRVIENDGEAYSVFAMTQFSNMSDPTWTHDQYAFASFNTENIRGHDGNDSSLSQDATIPALRGNMNCTLAEYYTESNLSSSILQWPRLIVDPPVGCYPKQWHYNQTGTRQLYLELESLSEDGFYVMNMEDTYDEVSGEFIDGQSRSLIACDERPPNQRQHYWYSAGHYVNCTGTWENLSVLYCAPYIEALLVHTSFSLPSLQVLSSTPNETSAVPLSTDAGATALSHYHIGKFVNALEAGKDGTPVSEFSGIANVHRFQERLDHLYRVYIAQTLHFSYRFPASQRLPANTTNNPATAAFVEAQHSGTLTDSTRLRLMQSSVSTRILEGLFTVMALCLCMATVLERHTKILPVDPGSIAAKMSLFANGELWRTVGARGLSDEEIERRGLLEGVVFWMDSCGGEEIGGGRRWFGIREERIDEESGDGRGAVRK